MKWTDIHDRAKRDADLLLRRMRGEEASVSDQEENEMLRRLGTSVYWREKIPERERYDYEEAFRKLKKHKRNRRLFRLSVTIGVAACFVATIGLSIVLPHKSADPGIIRVENGISPVPVPGKREVTLTLVDGSRMSLGRDSRILNQNEIRIAVDSGKINYNTPNLLSSAVPDSTLYHMLDIPRGGEYRVILADGTIVWLNADSQLKYPVVFTGDKREVFLRGEAYFEVVENKQKPFIVSTERGNISVYGTAFNVKQYPEEKQIEVTLVMGKVGFTPPDLPEVGLSPGHQLIYAGAGTMPCVSPVNVGDYIGWKENLLCFEDKSLEDIMRVLSRWYDVNIDFESPDLKKLAFSGNLDKYSDIQSFFRLFEISMPIVFEVQGEHILVRKDKK